MKVLNCHLLNLGSNCHVASFAELMATPPISELGGFSQLVITLSPTDAPCPTMILPVYQFTQNQRDSEHDII